MTHICVNKLTIIGSDNGLSPDWRTNVGILLIGPLGINFNKIWFEIRTFSFKKIHLKMSSGKWQPFCLGLNVLILLIVHSRYVERVANRFVVYAYSCTIYMYKDQGYIWPWGSQINKAILRTCEWYFIITQMSWHGNFICVIDHFWGEYTSDRWILLAKIPAVESFDVFYILR